jgi:hypothetical protein
VALCEEHYEERFRAYNFPQLEVGVDVVFIRDPIWFQLIHYSSPDSNTSKEEEMRQQCRGSKGVTRRLFEVKIFFMYMI